MTRFEVYRQMWQLICQMYRMLSNTACRNIWELKGEF